MAASEAEEGALVAASSAEERARVAASGAEAESEDTTEALTSRRTAEAIYLVTGPLFGIVTFRGKQVRPRPGESRREAIRRYRRSLRALGYPTKEVWRGVKRVKRPTRAAR